MIAGPNSPLHSSRSPEWYTPPDLARRVYRVLDGIDLDPAAPVEWTSTAIGAIRYYTPADDGLSHPWHGKVYLNPPYGRTIAAWMQKAAEEIRNGNTTAAIILWRSSTDTAAWRTITAATSRTCFISGRLRFSGSTAPAPFPSCAFYYGPHPERFEQEFNQIGQVWTNPTPAGGDPE